MRARVSMMAGSSQLLRRFEPVQRPHILPAQGAGLGLGPQRAQCLALQTQRLPQQVPGLSVAVVCAHKLLQVLGCQAALVWQTGGDTRLGQEQLHGASRRQAFQLRHGLQRLPAGQAQFGRQQLNELARCRVLLRQQGQRAQPLPSPLRLAQSTVSHHRGVDKCQCSNLGGVADKDFLRFATSCWRNPTSS